MLTAAAPGSREIEPEPPPSRARPLEHPEKRVGGGGKTEQVHQCGIDLYQPLASSHISHCALPRPT